jgi:hypothetical protein
MVTVLGKSTLLSLLEYWKVFWLIVVMFAPSTELRLLNGYAEAELGEGVYWMVKAAVGKMIETIQFAPEPAIQYLLKAVPSKGLSDRSRVTYLPALFMPARIEARLVALSVILLSGIIGMGSVGLPVAELTITLAALLVIVATIMLMASSLVFVIMQ